MSPMKVMPLLLTGITSFVILPGAAVRAAEPQIILAQFQSKEQQEEERKKHQQQQQNQQHPQQQQQQQPHGQDQHHPQQPHGPDQHSQQQHGQEQQHQAQEKALEQQRLKEHDAGHEQHGGQPGNAAAQHQQELLRQQQDAHNKALEDQRLHADQAKIHELQEKQRREGHELQLEKQKEALQQHQQAVTRHELSADEQRLRAAREEHRFDREKLIQQQRQAAATEKSPAAINERLRLQNEHFRAINSQRHEIVDASGHKIIQEPGNRTIFRVNNQVFIRHDEAQNFRLYGGPAQTQRAPNGNSISTIVRPDGGRLEIEVDTFGRPIRRVRFLPDGRRFVLFENRALAVGLGIAAIGALAIALPPIYADIPPQAYIVDAAGASEDDIYGALDAPPVEPLDRTYTLDEVLASVSLRERLRSVSIDTINFEFGSWEVGPQQAAMLESVAAVLRRITNDNPGETFLVEGHTDAVGSEEDNLSLSDRRAQAVADVLSQQFGVPRENLVTQGYGKQFLLISDRWTGTQEPARGCPAAYAASSRRERPRQQRS